MKEQSHKDEMSAALRGDFQRLRERGVAVSLAPSEAETSSSDGEPGEPDGAPTAPAEPVIPAEPEHQAAEAVVPESEPVDGPGPPQSGWLDRLLGR